MSAFTTELHDSIAVVTFDLPGEPVNKLSAGVKVEFEALLIRLRDDADIRAVVLISGKSDTFIAGADIEEFTALTTQAEAERLSFEGQEMVSRVETLAKPVVAAIHGACLGGGLELALACHYRVVSDHPKTQLGLPEVQLGLIPGAGGCQRLPRLIGLRAALDMILTGKSERATKALRLGLVDEVVPRSILRRTAIAAAERLTADGFPRRDGRGGLPALFLDRTPAGRRLVYRRAKAQILERTGGHYPAALAALETVRVGLEHGITAGLAEEHHAFGHLAVGDVSRKLVQIFFATTGLKKDDGIPAGSATPRQIRRLGVVGAGFMGAGIAGTAVLNVEVDTRLKDADLTRVGKGLGVANSILTGRLERRRITRPQHERLSALLSGGDTYAGFGRADLVIEAVFEDLALKRKVLAEVEAVTRPDTIFASNTSTIPIHQIAAEAQRPERVLGMHFFSPVEKMPLLEVIPTGATAPEAIVTAVRFGRRMGKTVIVVGDRPGFWVNRILSPYLNEAGLMVAGGVPVELIDKTAVAWGFPVGPIALLDEIGLDVAHKAAETMHGAYGDRMKGGDALDRMLAAGRLGRKNGRGFYRYRDGRKAGADGSVNGVLGARPVQETSAELVERRLVFAMLNEAAAACSEEVVRSPRDGDVGAIYGIGFPAFRGGPLRVIDDLGASRVVSTLHELEDQFGERFRPAPALSEMARQGRALLRDMNGFLRLLVIFVVCYLVFLVVLRLGESRLLYVPGNSRHLAEPPQELGLEVRRVELTASDGVRLVAWAMPADSGSGYWLLICHGNAGNISEAGRPYHYAGLRALGLSLFAFDYRGYGESEGVPTEPGLYRDADAAYRYLRDTLNVPADRIVVFGHSLGSAVAVQLVSRVPAAGLVLDGALTSVVERAQELFPYAPVRWIAASRYRSIDRVGALTIPKLFLHARDDEVVPFAHGRRLFEAAAPPKRFVPLQGGHGDAFEADSAAYYEAIGRFVAELAPPT